MPIASPISLSLFSFGDGEEEGADFRKWMRYCGGRGEGVADAVVGTNNKAHGLG